MIVEVRRAGFVNKGAELMLHAVVQQIRNRYPDAIITMAPIFGVSDDTYLKMRDLGLYPKVSLWRHQLQWGHIGNFIPWKLRRLYGLVIDREVDVVLDAAGFSYSDQWGVGNSIELSRSSKKWKKQGSKLILLPQAFGPYEEPKSRNYVKHWVNNAELVFAREQDSYEHLVRVVGEKDKLKLFPDFTNLVEGVIPEGYELTDNKIALVPNYRMIDKTDKKESDAYVSFMIKCAQYLVSKGKKAFVLVHEGVKDQKLAEQISSSAGGIPIIKETDPLKIKGIIGSCEATIGSRFHGLVSALSQGVPSLATGWSHKYQRLFEDYDFSEGLVSVLDSNERIEDKIDMIIEPDTSKAVKEKILMKSDEMKRQTNEMWSYVFDVMDAVNVHNSQRQAV